MSDEPFQLMPPLPFDAFEALKADIQCRGVLVPVEFDENSVVLDGHHRLRACLELGIASYPRVVRAGLTEAEKRAHVIALNVHRRHLSAEQRAEAVAPLRAEGWSVRRIALETGVPRSTVARDLASARREGRLDEPPTIRGADGVEQAARKPRRPASVFVQSAGEQRRAVEALSVLDGAAPSKTVDLRRLERLRREHASSSARAARRPAGVSGRVEVRHSSIAELDVSPGTVDLVLTDPPYRGSDFDAGTWGTLAARASDWLKPGGLLITYTGHQHLPRALTALAAGDLDYWWTFAIVHARGRGVRQVRQRAVGSTWRPLLVHRKRGGNSLPPWTLDTFPGGGPEKNTTHPWQQGVAEAEHLITTLTTTDALVVDPFVGSGTIAVAAALTGRRCVAGDHDLDHVALASDWPMVWPLGGLLGFRDGSVPGFLGAGSDSRT